VDLATYEQAGLYDPASPTALDRVALLEFLEGRGVTLDEMVEANSRDRLYAVLFDRVLRPGVLRCTLAEIAAKVGLSVEAAARARRSVGLPDAGTDAPIYGEADIEMLVVFANAERLFGEDVAVQLGRVMGSSMSRIAEAEVAAFLLNIAAPLAAEDAGEVALARANADVAALIPDVNRLLDHLLRQHLDAAIRRFNVPRPELGGYQTVELAVGFADLVGFTALSQQLSVRELAEAIRAFEEGSAEIIGRRGGRVVKLIGDEVMFVADSAASAVDTTVALLEAFDDRSALPPLRSGLACGPVLARDGDYFGPVVNLASRSVKLARAGGALVSQAVRTTVGEPPPGWRFGIGRPRRVRGFDGFVSLHTLRRSSRARLPVG
jgi:class 3 adenylate cyclase